MAIQLQELQGKGAFYFEMFIFRKFDKNNENYRSLQTTYEMYGLQKKWPFTYKILSMSFPKSKQT